AANGSLIAIIEAFALGQMRTGAMSGVATRWMADEAADVFALIGTGKQALPQLAAVAAVRKLKTVRVWSRDVERRRTLVQAAHALGYRFSIEEPETLTAATDGALIVTLVTRAREPFFTSAMASRGTHINAVGAITPERAEFTEDVLRRASLIAADDPVAARTLSHEFTLYFAHEDWDQVRPISEIVAQGVGRKPDCGLSLFKALGMGISDLALGIEIYRRAVAGGRGRPLELPRRTAPRLGAP